MFSGRAAQGWFGSCRLGSKDSMACVCMRYEGDPDTKHVVVLAAEVALVLVRVTAATP